MRKLITKILSMISAAATRRARIAMSPLRPKPDMSVADALDKLTRRVYGKQRLHESGDDIKTDCLIAWRNARMTSAGAAARFSAIDPRTASAQTVESAFADMERARDDEREKLARVLLSSFSISADHSLTIALAHLPGEMTKTDTPAPVQTAERSVAVNGTARGC